jgi:2-phosphoglycerate kinase
MNAFSPHRASYHPLVPSSEQIGTLFGSVVAEVAGAFVGGRAPPRMDNPLHKTHAVARLAPSGDQAVRMERDWQVVLIGGASEVGKTSVSYRLAHHFGVGITEIDDFQVILERMTTPEQYPELHLFRTEPETFFRMNEDEKVAHMVRYATVMALPLEHVIANHLEDGAPIILEGDFILPSLAVRGEYAGVPSNGRVRAMFLYEPKEAQISRNYAAREGAPQPGRARASWRNSEWLRAEAGRRTVPAIEARPWDTVFERALAVLAPSGPGGDVPPSG